MLNVFRSFCSICQKRKKNKHKTHPSHLDMVSQVGEMIGLWWSVVFRLSRQLVPQWNSCNSYTERGRKGNVSSVSSDTQIWEHEENLQEAIWRRHPDRRCCIINHSRRGKKKKITLFQTVKFEGRYLKKKHIIYGGGWTLGKVWHSQFNSLQKPVWAQSHKGSLKEMLNRLSKIIWEK